MDENVVKESVLEDEALDKANGGLVPIPTVEASIRMEPDCPNPGPLNVDHPTNPADPRFIF